MKKHPLEGHMAIVRNDIPGIPVMLRGAIGTIIMVQRSKGALFIDLALDDKSTAGAFEAREITILRIPGEIQKSFEKSRATFSEAEALEIEKIIQLIGLGEERPALSLVLRNEKFQPLCLTDGMLWFAEFSQRMQRISKGKKCKPNSLQLCAEAMNGNVEMKKTMERKLISDIIYQKNCLTGLSELPDNSIQCCVTSPPYWRLRDYQVDGQLGLEETLEEYVDNLVAVFEEVKRVLKPDGTFWLNLGDSYNGYRANTGDTPFAGYVGRPLHKTGLTDITLKTKDLIGIPWTVAFALRDNGWWLRQEIIWHKKNCMPESVRDRCTRGHEQIFMFAKSPRYFYDADAIRTPLAESSKKDKRQISTTAYNILKNYQRNAITGRRDNKSKKSYGDLPVIRRSDKQSRYGIRHERFNERWAKRDKEMMLCKGANRRSVWSLPSTPYKGAHFATFPPALPELCIKAGSRPGDTILDPFMGSGTTAQVARQLGRHYIGFELNGDYVKLARERLLDTKHLTQI